MRTAQGIGTHRLWDSAAGRVAVDVLPECQTPRAPLSACRA